MEYFEMNERIDHLYLFVFFTKLPFSANDLRDVLKKSIFQNACVEFGFSIKELMQSQIWKSSS